jgi:hypothetical protein
MAKATRRIRPPTVTGDGAGLLSHAGLVWPGEVADRSGLTVGFSQVLASAPRRRHDPGVGLAQLVLTGGTHTCGGLVGSVCCGRLQRPARLLHSRWFVPSRGAVLVCGQ